MDPKQGLKGLEKRKTYLIGGNKTNFFVWPIVSVLNAEGILGNGVGLEDIKLLVKFVTTFMVFHMFKN